jgi:hypothetical protein
MRATHCTSSDSTSTLKVVSYIAGLLMALAIITGCLLAFQTMVVTCLKDVTLIIPAHISASIPSRLSPLPIVGNCTSVVFEIKMVVDALRFKQSFAMVIDQG